MAVVLAPIIVGLLGVAGVIASARMANRTATQSSLDTRAQQVLSEAMDSLSEQVATLKVEVGELRRENMGLQKDSWVAQMKLGECESRERSNVERMGLQDEKIAQLEVVVSGIRRGRLE